MTKNEIKELYSIESVLRSHGIPIYSRNRCRPICHDAGPRSKNAAFDKTRYTCFVCNIHHDVISLEMELSNCDFQTACRLISGEDLTREQQFKANARKTEQKLEAVRKAKERATELALTKRLRAANTKLKLINTMGFDWGNADMFAEAIAEQQKCEYRLGILE